MRITFWGAAGTVTGSRFVVDAAGRRVLVDCGLFQGIKAIRQRNWEPFPVDPASIDAVLLTHAHIDHTGYLPALVRDGFRGDVWASPATRELCGVLLPDAAHLQEEDARHANFRHSSKHHPALPLYRGADAEEALRHIHDQPFHAPFNPVPGIDAVFSPVGHILGAGCVRIGDGETTVTFTGDVGRPVDPIMLAPEPPLPADYLVTESTYGNRAHGTADPLDELEAVVVRTLGRGGTLLIPVFAVGRAQTVLHLLAELRGAGRIPEVPTYLNSPMAVDATEMFCAHKGEHRLSDDECKEMCRGVELVRTAEDSKRISPLTGPQIVLAASGMASGGRVLHHLEVLAPDRRNTVLFVGFQASGTRGEAMLSGAPSIKLYGNYVPVRAEVVRMDSLSAHADATELISWLGTASSQPERAFIVHGEPSAADALRRSLGDELGWRTHVAEHGETVELAPQASRLAARA